MSFELNGINHLALVCRDMDVTVDFYCNTLGMELTKTIELADGRGKHYFFNAGGGDAIAFFYFPDGPQSVSERELRKISAVPGTMNHVAFDVPADQIDDYRKQLITKGVQVTEVVNHDDSASGSSNELNESTFVRSLYFNDPDGTQLEFAAWVRPLTEQDVENR